MHAQLRTLAVALILSAAVILYPQLSYGAKLGPHGKCDLTKRSGRQCDRRGVRCFPRHA